MKIKQVQIVDLGRGPQIEGHRLTVMDIFYYLHRGRDFEFIQRAMPSLTREEFDAVVAYVNDHREELVEEDRQVEERIRQDLAAQKAKGLDYQVDETIAVEERATRMKEKLRQRLAEKGEKNVGHLAP